MSDTVSAEQAMRARPKAAMREDEQPEHETPKGHIVVFVCPTPSCGNYYASPNFVPDDPSLDDMQYKRNEKGDRTPLHTRRECPDCWLRDGTRVPRVPYIIADFIRFDKMVEAVEKHIARRQKQKEDQ